MLLILILNTKLIAEDFNLLSGLYKFLSKNVKHKRLLLALISSVFGVLPIYGRNILSAPVLNSFVSDDKNSKNRIGLVNYLMTHHYYLWSPLEKTILIPMVALSLSYIDILKYTFPLLLVMTIFSFGYMFIVLKENDIVFNAINVTSQNKIKRKWKEYINWRLMIYLSCILFLNWIVEHYSEYLTGFIDSSILLSTAAIVSFCISFLLGSSAKFTGILIILVSIYGLEYFTFFMAIQFTAYLLSPMHKCIVITNEYFKTDYLYFYKVIGILSALIILIGILSLYL